MSRPLTLTLSMLLVLAQPVAAAPAPLSEALRARIDGDRTGACLAVALIDGERVERATRCADPTRQRAIEDAAFEIGSVTKPMTAFLLAQLIAEGRAALDDPLTRHLPPGTVVPQYEGRPILLRHLVTHTSGLPALPPGMAPRDPADPYAGLTAAELLVALGRTRLARAPGDRFEYSNFAMMLLSHAVARIGGADFESMLDARLFTPLGMHGAHLARRPAAVRVAQGHLAAGRPTAAWTFEGDLGGVGGVRATLDDMTRYVRAHLEGSGQPALDAALALTLEPLSKSPPMGMNWMLRSTPRGTVAMHEGGTGGFSSFVAFAPASRRGVVVLSDTSMGTAGGLAAFGLHVLDPTFPAARARRHVDAPADLLAALTGRYELEGGLGLRLWAQDGRLWAQADGQPAFELAHDDAGDFHPLAFDALLRPVRAGEGGYTLQLMQGGGSVPARRVDGAVPAPSHGAAGGVLAHYTGRYALAPGFALDFTVRDGRLHVQATGQGVLGLSPAGADAFAAPAVGAGFRFERDAGGAVVAVTLRQNGQVLRGEKAR